MGMETNQEELAPVSAPTPSLLNKERAMELAGMWGSTPEWEQAVAAHVKVQMIPYGGVAEIPQICRGDRCPFRQSC